MSMTISITVTVIYAHHSLYYALIVIVMLILIHLLSDLILSVTI